MQNFITRYRSGRDGLATQVFIFLMACLLAGCGAARLGYANGETISYWWLDGYVDIEPEQQPLVKKHLDDLFTWHRQTQLRDYVQLLTGVQKRLQSTVSATDISADTASIKKRMVVLTEKAAPQLADFALSLEPQQLVNMEKKFVENDAKYRKEYLRGDVEARQRFRFKKVMNQAEYWFGNFSNEQEARIRAASDARPLNNEIWFAEKVRRQGELLAILKKVQAEKPSHEAVTAALKTYLAAGIDKPAEHPQKRFFDASADSTAQLTTTVINLATPSQKDHAVRKVQQWIDDFNTLAAKRI
ncbi:MAG: hypothetical protein H7315_08085 [Herminiimonas sp.]|nr:hypothetical protein [Herminiimonas sp.]